MAKIFTGKEYLDEEFYGKFSVQEKMQEIKNLFSYANKIRKKLEDDDSLLREYMLNMFRDLNQIKAHEAADEGYRKMKYYKRVCSSIQNKTWRYKNDFIYPHMCKFIDENPSDVDGEFFSEYYLAQMFEMLSESAIDDFLGDMAEIIESPFKRRFYQNITEEIADFVGEKEMDKFNKMFFKTLIISPAIQFFMQGFINALIENYVTYDCENEKYIFEYQMENLG